MANYFANVATSDTFYVWLDSTNELLHSLATEIITANTTTAYTGNSSTYRIGVLQGRFTSNTLVAFNDIRGGNTSASNTLTVSSNVVHIGHWANSYANVHIADSTANVVVSDNFRVIGNTNIQYVDESDAIIIAKDTDSNVHITATEIYANSDNTFIVSNTTITGNSYLKANSSIFNVNTHTDGTISNVDIFADSISIFSGNVHITGTNLHTIAGDVNFDSQTLYVDASADSVGIGTSTPGANLHVTGTANVNGIVHIGGNTFIDNTAIIIGNTSINDPSEFRVHDASGWRLIVEAGGNVGIGTTSATNAKLDVRGTANVSGNMAVEGTFTGTGAATLKNTLTVLNNITLANNSSTVTVDTDKFKILAGGNIGIGTSTPNAKLQVAGTANVAGAVHLGSTLDVTSTSTFGNSITLENNVLMDTQSTTLNSTNWTSLYTFTAPTYRGGKFVATCVQGSANTQTSEFVVSANSTSAALTVYGTVSIGSDVVDFRASASTGTITIEGKAATASPDTDVKIFANLIK